MNHVVALVRRQTLSRFRRRGTGRSIVLLSIGVFLSGAVQFAAARQSSLKVDISTIGPKVGDRVPDFVGTDQNGRRYTLSSSMGAKGLMLVFFRSADW